MIPPSAMVAAAILSSLYVLRGLAGRPQFGGSRCSSSASWSHCHWGKRTGSSILPLGYPPCSQGAPRGALGNSFRRKGVSSTGDNQPAGDSETYVMGLGDTTRESRFGRGCLRLCDVEDAVPAPGERHE